MARWYRKSVVILLAVLIAAGGGPGWLVPSAGTVLAGPEPVSEWQPLGEAGMTDAEAASVSLEVIGDVTYLAYYMETSFSDGQPYYKPFLSKFANGVWSAPEALTDVETTANYVNTLSTTVYMDMLFVAYADPSVNHAISTKYYNPNSSEWTQLDVAGFSDSNITLVDLTLGGHFLYLAAGDAAGNLTLYTFAEAYWYEVGEIHASAPLTDVSVTGVGEANVPIVGYADSEGVHVKFYDDEGIWQEMNIPNVESSEIKLVYDNDDHILYAAHTVAGGGMRVVALTTHNWAPVGQDIAAELGQMPAGIDLVLDGSTVYAAYSADYGQDGTAKASVVKFNGSDWESIGQYGFTEGKASRNSLAVADGIPSLAFIDGAAGDRATVATFKPGAGMKTPPALTADPDLYDGGGIAITFNDDSAWRDSINSVKLRRVGDSDWNQLMSSDYEATAGKLTIKLYYVDGAIEDEELGDYEILVIADGYADAIVTQNFYAPTVVPDTPTATAGDGTVVLNWNAVAGASGYIVYGSDHLDDLASNPSLWEEIDGNVLTYTHEGLSNGTKWHYAIKAEFGDAVTTALSAAASATPTAAVTAPKAITTFDFLSLAATGTVNESAKTVQVTVPYGTDVTSLTPTIGYIGASITPGIGTAQDFTNPVTYTVKATDSTTQTYTVTVTIAPEPIVPVPVQYAWQNLGGSSYSSNALQFHVLAANEDDLYIAIAESGALTSLKVKKFDGQSWSDVGEFPGKFNAINRSDFVVDGENLYAAIRAYADNKAYVFEYKDNQWTELGDTGVSEGVAGSMSLAAENGTPYLALVERIDGMDVLVTKKFNNGAWELLPGEIEPGEPPLTPGAKNYNPSLQVKDGIPYLAYTALNMDHAKLKKHEGGQWIQLGGGTIPAIKTPIVTVRVDDNGIPYVAYANLPDGSTTHGETTVARVVDNAWEFVGGTAFIDNMLALYPAFYLDGTTPYIGYSDLARSMKATVKRFNGTSWEAVGPDAFTAGEAHATSLVIQKGVPHLAFLERTPSNRGLVSRYAPVTDTPSTYTIAPISDVILTAKTAGYPAGSQQTQTVTIEKTGTGNLSGLNVALSGTNADRFVITQPALTSLDAGNVSTTFTVKAADGLPAGTYEAIVTIQAANMTDVSFKVTQAINAASGNPGSSTGSTSTSEEKITVNVEDGGKSGVVSTVEVKRTRQSDGTKKDAVDFTESKVRETIDTIRQAGAESANIVIPDGKDEVSEVNVTVPKAAGKLLADAKIALGIVTNNVKVQIPTSSLEGFADDLYFQFIPIKKEEEKQLVKERAKQETIVKIVAGDNEVTIVGRPMTIETNMQSRPVTLTMPLGDVNLSPEELADLGIYIEHSDGTKELVRGTLVPFDDSGAMGLEFTVNKFSTFTLVHIDGMAQEAAPTQRHAAYMRGYEDGTFRPEKSISRAELAAVLARTLELDHVRPAVSFRDLRANHWAADDIADATAMGLMSGYADGIFGGERAVTRAEMAAVAAMLIGSSSDAAGNGFSDTAGHWAENSIRKVQAANLMQGYADGEFRPDASLTRAEAVVIMNKLLARETASGSTKLPWSDVTASHWAYAAIGEASLDHEYREDAAGREAWTVTP